MPLTIDNAFSGQSAADFIWIKGNLHTHTTRSDGHQPPQDVVDAYAEKGYGFLALSDHDVWSDYTKINARGMELIQANEVTANGPHVLQVGGTKRVDPKKERQQVIQDISTAGGFAVLNHPNWQEKFDHFTLSEMLRLENYLGIEIFNGVCVGEKGSGYAIEKWDRLLHSGRRAWGFAHDDSHRFEHIGKGWIVARVHKERRTPDGILDAIRSGSFYASTGVTIDSIQIRGTTIHVSSDAEAVEVIGDCGKVLDYIERSEASFDVKDCDCYYVRVQFYGVGRKRAWTQPFYIRGGIAERRRELEVSLNNRPASRLHATRVSEKVDASRPAELSIWKDVPESLLPFNLRTGFEPDVQTAVKAVVTPTHLIFNFRCDEPLIDKMVVKCASDGDPASYNDECIELFLDVEGTRKHYYQLIANALGKTFATHHREWEKDLRYNCSVQRHDGGWNLYLALLLDSLGPGVNTKPGAQYGLHICRNRPGTHQAYVWAWVGGSNHSPERFGALEI